MLQSMGSQRVGHDWMTERLNNNNTNDHVTESLNSHNPIHFSHEISVYPFLMKKLKLEYSVIKNPPAMQETLVWFLGWEDPLEKP